jgi:hypothetical protein
MSKHDTDDFKYNIPDNMNYNNDSFNEEEEVHMTYDDELSWENASYESEGEEETENKKDSFLNKRKSRPSYQQKLGK